MTQTPVDLTRATIGIEFGSTRIKAVLTDERNRPVATGGHDWENQFENQLWTYDLDDVWTGVQTAFADLSADVERRLGTRLTHVGAIGISGMMHGYLAVDEAGTLLAPFRTWRNTVTHQAAAELTELFGFNIPLRWSVAHVRQAMLDGEPHVASIARLNTLAGYVHERLTGEFVLGVGDASGMFPIDPTSHTWDAAMLAAFADLVQDDVPWSLADILPSPLVAGAPAGTLTPEGAALLDPTGTLQPGAPLCPPEGDVGTGMVATNTVARRTGNVSAGTSIFLMVVLERALGRVHEELDVVATPAGDPAAMVHVNNFSSDLNAWVKLFGSFADLMGSPVEPAELYESLYLHAMTGDADGGGLLNYNYLSGEHITGVHEGRPLFVRTPDARFTLANFVRTLLMSSLATLRIGMDILADEGVAIDRLLGHGGFFKTERVGQRLMAAALRAPVSVGEVAGEGGAWGMSLLAAYARDGTGRPLHEWLDEVVFADATATTADPEPDLVEGFAAFVDRFRQGLEIELVAARAMPLA